MVNKFNLKNMENILRTNYWLENQKLLANNSIAKLLNSWGLNVPLTKLTPDKKKQAGFVMETVMAAYGLFFEDGILDQIVDGFYPSLDGRLQGKLTDNHKSLAVSIHGDGINTAVKYAPVLTGSLEIGALSPLKVALNGNDGVLSFAVGDVSWQLGINFAQPPPHATTKFHFQNSSYFGKSYVDACVSSQKGGFVLVDTGHLCEQGCKFCTYEQGQIVINQDNFIKVEQVLDFIASKTSKITACFSSGSALTPDRGIVALFSPMLQTVDKLKAKYPNLKVELELELMPWETTEDEAVLDIISKYHQKGYVKAVNLNLETPYGIDRNEFMSTEPHGKANIPIIGQNGFNRGYLETFQLLKNHFPNLQLAGLILFGLKPKTMNWIEYVKLALETVNIFAQNDVKILFQPVKIASTTPIADYPTVDIFWLTGSVLATGLIHLQYGFDKKPKVGCVNGCDACDSSRGTYSLLKYFQKLGGEQAVSQLFSPWLEILNKEP